MAERMIFLPTAGSTKPWSAVKVRELLAEARAADQMAQQYAREATDFERLAHEKDAENRKRLAAKIGGAK